MAGFELYITTDNDAFTEDADTEVARILRNLADHIDSKPNEFEYPLHDVNGNRVGKAEFTA
jgi:hypothetical protein